MTPKRPKLCQYCDFSRKATQDENEVLLCTSSRRHAQKRVTEETPIIVDAYDKACRFYRTCLRKLPCNKKYEFKDKIDA